jgi:hypothetical protein
MQAHLPWTDHYNRRFRASEETHKDFRHALAHVHKAAGRLSEVVERAEHGGADFSSEEVDKYLADLVICTMRMANTTPGRIVDLERVVVERVAIKNQLSQESIWGQERDK